MKNILVFGLLISALTLTTHNANAQSVGGEYKCLIQLKNYQGEGAYVIVSIVNSKGDYIETLRVLGDDHEWYPDLKSWYACREKARHQPRLDGVTGATIGSGERSVVAFEINKKYIDQAYTLRFESAVEDKSYHAKDVVVQLTSEQLKLGKYEGTEGYIRQVRLIPVNK
ncbi:DUF2271 domain-containing protein [Brumimicrobium glaciale]|uniref:DUF2271 domain-containing protein n=1 Tax=Brumimicrobium glaciale TaxID=200475 RepID=A0A4Q4KNV9_9FLAO|nr:DUF2271 domain-containing protein [Brumimicrobium glaciale]RYM35153.1 DUF2271 domain-containing protein [Brumimicrobium glaciale]